MARAATLDLSSPAPLPAVLAYDLAASSYDAWPWQAFWRRHEFPVVLQALERLRRRGRATATLDVGCGTGWYLEHLRPPCGESVGIDASPGMLAVARHRLPDATLLQSDARTLPFRAGRFGLVLCTRVLSHVRQVVPALSEMERVLAAGGILVLSDVDADHDYENTRLPVPGGHVSASTFKHPRDEVFGEVERRGFLRDSAFDIHLDGTVRKVKGRRRRAGPPVASWIGIWRRDGSGDGEARPW